MPNLKVNEIFSAIQGEGRYAGSPCLFIRLSGCNRKCSWCDSKYHTENMEKTPEALAQLIKEDGHNIIVWTGGEPMLQHKAILEVMKLLPQDYTIHNHLESNGTIIDRHTLRTFSYIAFSPKDRQSLDNIKQYLQDDKRQDQTGRQIDIKIVTDLVETGMDMLHEATILMPLTTGLYHHDMNTRRKVWEYCTTHRIHYGPRLHVMLWGDERRK